MGREASDGEEDFRAFPHLQICHCTTGSVDSKYI